MIDVLLINSPILRTNRDPDSGSSVPPIGLGYIYTQLTLSGYECQFIDAIVDNLLPNEIVGIINQSHADYIGLNIFSSNLDIVRDIVKNVTSPRTFLLGGPAIHTLVSEIGTWDTNNSIIVITGEAELILPEVIKNPMRWGESSANMRIIHITPESPFYPSNIDLPLDRSIFKNEPIQRPDLGLVESHVIASRGCLYNCAFCTAATSLNQHLRPRYRSYESLSKEIETIRTLQPRTNCIRVLDDLFLRDQASIELATRLFSESGLFWRSMAHISTFRDAPPNWLDDIKKSGCRELFIGVESGNDETLRHIRKPFSADVAYRTISRILDAQIPVKCYFILGFPGETEADVKDTVALASRLKSYASRVGVQLRISAFRFRPYHGTALYDELVQKGQTITQIVNRVDTPESGSFNSYDCTSGVYAVYSESILDTYMLEMEKLNGCAQTDTD
ncbi:MAG TPA: radical SAM protein [Candidatus Cryosericum sp.]